MTALSLGSKTKTHKVRGDYFTLRNLAAESPSLHSHLFLFTDGNIAEHQLAYQLSNCSTQQLCPEHDKHFF